MLKGRESMKGKWKRVLAFLEALIIVFMTRSCEAKTSPERDPAMIEVAYGSYDDGLIFIGDEFFLEQIHPEEGDILVLDQRDARDPNMKIISSHLVRSARDRDAILQVLCQYEEEDPSRWERTFVSMKKEWRFHNWCHAFMVEPDRSADVDLNNADEEIYHDNVLQKILKP